MSKIIVLVLVSLLLPAAVAYPFSLEALEHVDRSVTFIELQQRPDTFIGRELLLGGTILAVEKRRAGMRLEIAQLPLAVSGRPVDGFRPQGRFLVTVPDELDQRDYHPGAQISVIGTVSSGVRVIVDDEESLYPVLTVREMQLWPSVDIERRMSPRETVVVLEQEPETVYRYEYREPYAYFWPYSTAPLFPWWFGASVTFGGDHRSHFPRPSQDHFPPAYQRGPRPGGGGAPPLPRRDRR